MNIRTAARWCAGSLLLGLFAMGCARRHQQPADAELRHDYDPYTATPRLRVDLNPYLRQPAQVPRSATGVNVGASMAFVRDPALGDLVALQIRHECSYESDGRRVECLSFACSPKRQRVAAHAILDGAPAELPAFDCKGYGKMAVDYSAAFSRASMHRVAGASQLWLRLPTGEFGLDAPQLTRVRDFMAEVERTPARSGPAPVDLRR